MMCCIIQSGVSVSYKRNKNVFFRTFNPLKAEPDKIIRLRDNFSDEQHVIKLNLKNPSNVYLEPTSPIPHSTLIRSARPGHIIWINQLGARRFRFPLAPTTTTVILCRYRELVTSG